REPGRATRRTRAAGAAIDASRRLIGAGPQIVLKAISVLEEEVVASGLGAAKRIEQRFLNVDELRAQHPDAVMSRFRDDLHGGVDLAMDVLTAALQVLGNQAGRVVNVTAGRIRPGERSPKAAPAPAARGVPVVSVRNPVQAGATGELAMSLENESEQATAHFTLHVSELVTSSGARIPAGNVRFDPATLTVGPRGVGQVTIRIAVPHGTPPGSYEGVVRASNLEHLRAVLLLRVV
ncbi:MAG: hypothetical protein JWM27_1435, partial [Gemmatimonadetes bacterium]|nr:hypothetical protein [Gemmatimonadota bacterium]